MTEEEEEKKASRFLSAPTLLKTKGLGNSAWEDWQQSEFVLPKIGHKNFEPSGTWLQEMQLENGLKNRKRLIEIERVERKSQLALAEWLPGSQKAKVTKKSGHSWDSFGFVEKSQLFLLPEEAMILLEMNCLELSWNGMPLSIQQAYEVLINSPNSKCTINEYRVYSQLVRWGYKLQRFHDKLSSEAKSSSGTKRIIMNPEGLWIPNTSPTLEKQESNDKEFLSSCNSYVNEDKNGTSKSANSESSTSTAVPKLGIVKEETVLGSIKIIKAPAKDSTVTNKVSKWPGSRIQRNVKLMPKRNDILNSVQNNLVQNTLNSTKDSTNKLLNSNVDLPSETETLCNKRKNENLDEACSKKFRPEVIELSDDEIEEIPKPLTRLEILNTFPNLAGVGNEPIITKINRAYIPQNIKPIKEFYRFEPKKLLNLSQSDKILKSKVDHSNSANNTQQTHFYTQRSQCQSVTTYNSNNSYSYRGVSCQRDGNSFIQQNISHNAIHSAFPGTVLHSNYVNHVMMEVMGTMVRSFRQQQFQHTTFCQNSQFFPSRFTFPQPRFQPSFNFNYFSQPPNYYYRRALNGTGGYTSFQRGKGGASRYIDVPRMNTQEEINEPSFSKHLGVKSWSDLKKKWHEEATITIDDEDPMLQDNGDVQVVKELISPLINSKVLNLTDAYEKLRIIKSAPEKTVRSRKVDFCLSYEVFQATQCFKKSSPGTPLCRLFIINTRDETCLDISKLQKLQQESKDVPVVVVSVSQSCISYVQPSVAALSNIS